MLYTSSLKHQKIIQAIDDFSQNKISITKCAKKHGIHRETLAKYLKSLDVHKDRRHYDIDENFFEEINTEEKAYWLGFILADGCLKKNSNQLSINLSIKDFNHLEKFKKNLKSDKPITTEDVEIKKKSTKNVVLELIIKKSIVI